MILTASLPALVQLNGVKAEIMIVCIIDRVGCIINYDPVHTSAGNEARDTIRRITLRAWRQYGAGDRCG